MAEEKHNEIEFSGMLTKAEFLKLFDAVKRDGVVDEDELTKLVNWAIEKRTGTECVNLIIEGFLTVDGWDGDEPHLIPPPDVIEAMANLADAPMLEEMMLV